MSEILLTTMTMNEVIRLDATPAFGAYTKFARRRCVRAVLHGTARDVRLCARPRLRWR